MNTDMFPSATLSFDDFWSLWPRKTARKISEQAWMRLNIVDQKLAMNDCVARYKNTPKQFVPHASTYLNGARWEDEIVSDEPTSNAPPPIHSQSYKVFVPVEHGTVGAVGRDAIARILKR